jgi:hypothetical protein
MLPDHLINDDLVQRRGSRGSCPTSAMLSGAAPKQVYRVSFPARETSKQAPMKRLLPARRVGRLLDDDRRVRRWSLSGAASASAWSTARAAARPRMSPPKRPDGASHWLRQRIPGHRGPVTIPTDGIPAKGVAVGSEGTVEDSPLAASGRYLTVWSQ